MTPSLATAIIRDFEPEAAKSKSVLAAVPESKFDWKPHEKSMTLRELAAHVAEAPMWLHSMLEGDEMDFEGMEETYKPFAPKSHTELMEAHDANVKAFCEGLAGQEDEFLLRDWTMRKGEKILMKSARTQIIREIMIHHVAHHRGQLTVYLRLLDVPVPATYGPSADDNPF